MALVSPSPWEKNPSKQQSVFELSNAMICCWFRAVVTQICSCRDWLCHSYALWTRGRAAGLACWSLLPGLPDAVSAMVLAFSFPLFCGDLSLAPGTLPSALLAGSWPMCSYEDISLTSQGWSVMGSVLKSLVLSSNCPNSHRDSK